MRRGFFILLAAALPVCSAADPPDDFILGLYGQYYIAGLAACAPSIRRIRTKLSAKQAFSESPHCPRICFRCFRISLAPVDQDVGNHV
jgi:hypothetical protein